MKEKTVNFKAYAACRAFQDNDKATQLWNLTIEASELPQGLPYGPNARNADLKARPVKAMLQTLQDVPEQFIYYNNGIMIVAQSLNAKRVEGGIFEVSIKYLEPSDEEDFVGHGVLNGGHTYKAVMYALYGSHKRNEKYPKAGKAYIQLSVTVGIEESEVADISRARNLSKAVPDYALENLKGNWKVIEENLPFEYRKNVIFKPDEFQDDPDLDPQYTVVDLVQRLALLNNRLFDFRKDSHPIRVYSGKGSLIKHWTDEQYQDVLPRLKDILWLEEKIMEAHERFNGHSSTGGKIVISRVSGCQNKPSKLITGREFKLTIAPPFVMPILAAFRVLLKDGQWIKPIEDLWKDYGELLVGRLWDTYKTEGRASAASFGRSKSTWSALTNVIAMQFVQIQL